MPRSSSLRLEPVETDKKAIHCLVHLEPSPHPWLLSAIYRPSRSLERPSFWKHIQSMSARVPGPMLIVGDLNRLIDLGVIGGSFFLEEPAEGISAC
ncbi:Endonuclease/exonuclease/phosphatase [Parasponia andersonii]|uniref:Endonuclease/exonuclease/phosphatase n=1 Tax=Parasponia andersonii TaxID=3476 RepID=A0A2P5C5G7_PARAD|nr:Endonuclease/exonuclease/phosphatase [Parasponia andersonii]